MKKLWNWIKGLFTAERIGVIWRAMFTATKNAVAQMVSDPDNQQAALDLVKRLASSKLSNAERRKEFEAQMKSWAKAAGKTLSEAAINARRENAVVALKGDCADCASCADCDL